MRSPRLAAVAGIVLGALGLSACAPALPPSVVPDSSVVVGWSGDLTSFNAAADPTRGNLDVAAATRSSFGQTVDGEFVADESFGTVTVVSEDPFTVRYDLAEPAWSDGIPLDAADLLLGWASAVGLLREKGPAEPPPVPEVDEFERAIEVTYPAATSAWQTAVAVPVPAHVVGARAFELDDPMEAKQAVIRALEDGDAGAVAAIAEVWRDDFAITGGRAPAADLSLSSGPYLVSDVETEGDAQRVRLTPNPSYRGAAMPQIAAVELVPAGPDPVATVGETIDLVSVAPVADNREPIRERERRDFAVQTTHDGTVWSVLLSPDGVFSDRPARAAFLRAVPAADMVAAGAGEWAQAYAKTTSMLAAPDSRAFDIVTEDSGFAAALGTPADDAARDRAASGVRDRARVCVVYDRRSGFAKGAFAALRAAADEAGWSVADCGTDDVPGALARPGWDAAIDRVRVPETPAEIAAQWGSGGSASRTGHSDPRRDELIQTLSGTVDVYEARELIGRIEATIVDAAVARPLAAAPRVTIVDPSVTGVTVRNGNDAPVLSGVAQWSPAG